MKQFSLDWWLAYQKAWNQNPEVEFKFSGIGKVIFSFLDNQEISVCLEWDQSGQIIRVQEIENLELNLPIFSATKENWQKFIAQEIKAAQAVMTGKIKYQGSFTLILKYGKNFDYLAIIAQQVN
jgi:putative sterol carrier protein